MEKSRNKGKDIKCLNFHRSVRMIKCYTGARLIVVQAIHVMISRYKSLALPLVALSFARPIPRTMLSTNGK